MARRKNPPRHDRHVRDLHGGAFARGGRGVRYGALRRYALRDPANQPLRCHPGMDELAGRVPAAHSGNDGKVCFPDEAAARNALDTMGPPGRDRRVYQCTRLRGSAPDGHWHFTGGE